MSASKVLGDDGIVVAGYINFTLIGNVIRYSQLLGISDRLSWSGIATAMLSLTISRQ